MEEGIPINKFRILRTYYFLHCASQVTSFFALNTFSWLKTIFSSAICSLPSSTSKKLLILQGD